MAVTYKRLFDPTNQFEVRSGALNVNGQLKVFLDETDDLAQCFDENGTILSQPVILDSLGRARGLLVDDSKVYRLEVNDADGALLYTVRHMAPGGSGTGSAMGNRYSVTSSDGFVNVEEFDNAGVTTFDITKGEDSTELLEWLRCDGAEPLESDPTMYRPIYGSGTMMVGTRGVELFADRYYHVTATIRASKTSVSPNYDNIYVLFKLGDENVYRKSEIVDYSMGLSQDFEVSCDVHVDADAELTLSILGQDVNAGSFSVLNLEIHRVYSGAPAIPGGYIRQEQSDWAQEDEHLMSFIRNKPDLSVYATNAALQYGLAGKQDVLTAGANIQLNGSTISATDTTYTAGTGLDLTGTEFSVDTSTIQEKLTAGSNIVIEGNTISATAEPQLQANWAEGSTSSVQYIQNKPDLSVYATTSAMNTALAGKQDTISDLSDIRAGAQAGSTAVQPATLENYQEKLTAGSNVQISAQNVISATDTTYTAGNGLDLTGTEFSVDTNTVALKSDIPGSSQLVPGYTLPTDAGKVLMAGSTTYWASLSDYVTDTELSTILEGYQTALTAGTNIQISNGTISATDTTYTAGTALELTGTEFSVKVDGSTVTVNSSGELQAAPAITVDQTYDPTSTNPQSGTAVAEAVAGVDTSLFEAVYGQTSLADIQQAIANKRIIYCRVPSGNMARMAFLAFDFGYSVEFQYYRSLSSHSASDMTDEVYVYTVSSTGWTTTTRKTGVKVTAGTHMSQSYSNGTLTLNAAWPTVDQTYDASSENAQSGVAVAGALATKQDTLTAGTNIQISNGTISATDTTYTAGTGLDLTGTEFSVDTTTIATKAELADYVTDTELSTILQGYQEALTAGSNITISNGTISATDTTYTAGTGLDLTGTEFSVDTTTIATKAELADYTPTASLAAVALSNDYDDLSNKPVIPVLPTTKDLVAGSNITITEGQDTVTIAATAASYSAGSGLNLTGSTFSVDTTTIQEKLTAGSNITISGNTISSTAVPQLQANWAEGNTQSVQYIMNKPTIPVLPSTKDLVAGDNITLTEGNDDITVACSITIGTVTV
jgi:hypothetical protein